MQQITFMIEDKDWLRLRELAKHAYTKDEHNKVKPEPCVNFVAKDIMLGTLDNIEGLS